ncbi:acyltransferase family protein [Nesterenkonia sandarakina]|uniref:Peptidoglycan/LPS O-acetylase OafA/YrhL n=1 Tax=Nesterenkonia sandarakina TaxID=272918 RepID=A0A7Z0EAC7_9MICC|nr:acyltransferase family protein [Nesterenkonia sandarakina]NYJ17878.1 peptidoglycan/LPS O-acetylase OafA/YrhL [Nesterenkonia sandarakina]
MTAAVITPVAPMAHAPSKYRPDIQGLRAIAVCLVLLYHAGAPFLGGGFVGVDVFFVISGFLITGMLLRQSIETGRVDLADFYARRIRRILPAATVVLVFTAIATLLILPRTRWEDIGHDLIGSALYYANWVFAANTDYLNAETVASPLQHFWTLAVEEQFYILWPLLIVGLLFAVKKLRDVSALPQSSELDQRRIRRSLELGVALMILPSLAWSVYWTAAEPARAYFVTTTRLWELGIGAGIAVFAVYLERLPSQVRSGLQLGGLLCIGTAAVVYSSATPFPGIAAMLPTLGAAAVIVGGMAGRAESGAAKLLVLKPMTWVGDVSYSLYLWHWPLIVLGTQLLGDELRFRYGLLILVFALVPAWLSYTYIETPFRQWNYVASKPWRAIKVGLAMMLASAALGVALLVAVSSLSDDDAEGSSPALGAEALRTDSSAGAVVSAVDSFEPRVEEAVDDIPSLYDGGCHQEQSEVGVEPCVFGDADSDYVVALVGDSHAAHWLPGLLPIAETNGWRLETYTKSACSLNGVALAGEEGFYEECHEWGQRMMETLREHSDLDHVIVSASRYNPAEDAPESVPTGSVEDGYSQVWRDLEEAAIPVTVLLDAPRIQIDLPECVAEHPEQLQECAVDREQAIDASGYGQQRAAAESSGATPVDLNEAICPEQQCAPIIGSVLVYRDSHHLTATYARSLSSHMEEELRQGDELRFRRD